MMDFSGLVLAPCMAVFGEPFTIRPLVSQKSNPVPYEAQGIYREQPVDVPMADGTIFSSIEKTLGVRLADFPVEPLQGDQIVFRGTRYNVEDADPDGQGGTLLSLRALD